MKVLLSVASLLPSYGGPAVSVTRLATSLSESGVEVGIWAPDSSSKHSPLLGSGVERLTGTARQALLAFGHPDVLHDNGIWWRHNHRLAVLAASIGLPRVVSTRGMLEPWAFSHKGMKKKIAWRLYQHADLLRAACLHTTSPLETRNLERLGLAVPVFSIPNGVDLPNQDDSGRRSAHVGRPRSGVRTALFLGRLHPVKGVPMLIEAWSRVRPKGWRLRITGPDEMGHRQQLENAVLAAGLRDVVSFTGPADGPSKEAALAGADLCILPSYSESFGMVVPEALAHGVPVLTTTGAPWAMLPGVGCGWSVDATVNGIAEGLRQATLLDTESLRAKGVLGRAFVAANFSWPSVAGAMLEMYRSIRDGYALASKSGPAGSLVQEHE